MKKQLLLLIFLSIAFCSFNFAQNNRKWATYYGTANGQEYGMNVTTDNQGNVYLVGGTSGNDSVFAYNGFQNTNASLGGFNDAFIVKFDSLGNRLWASYYGGSAEDIAVDVVTDAQGNVYMTGYTTSTNFPTLNAGGGTYYQSTLLGNKDAFIVKFNSNGTRLWATYYGGSLLDEVYSIAYASGNIFLTGTTTSTNLPVQNLAGAYNQSNLGGGNDAFIVKFSNEVLLWSTYFGGSANEDGYSICIDYLGNIFLSGHTFSTNFPLLNAGGGSYFQSITSSTIPLSKMYLTKFNSNDTLVWSTAYGGSTGETNASVCTDLFGNIYLTGGTISSDFPTQNPGGGAYFKSNFSGGYGDAIIVKFTNSGVRTWATYYGDSGDDFGLSIVTDLNGSVYVGGKTSSVTNIAIGGFQNSFGGGSDNDAFLLKFDFNNKLCCATYYGESDTEESYGIATDFNNNIYLSGYSANSTGLAANGFQNVSNSGSYEAFLAKFSSCNLSNGINEETNFNTFSIFPNPATNQLTINSTENSIESRIIIYNVLGEILHNFILTTNIENIDISSLAVGVYLIERRSENNISRQKFIKQ